MRPIPEEILEKVLETRQTIANNADPKMKIILRRGFNSELFQVYTIEEAEDLTDLDVAASRPETTSLPAKLYAFTVKDGIANVKSKNLPYDEIEPWEDGIDISIGVSSVAIEFDGYWERDFQTKRFNLVTDEYPWLFYVRGGDLYGQKWLDDYIVLSTNVVKVCAIRGWVPVAGDTTNDQGLIVAYLKTDGTVWYKNYCIQVNGEKDWEIEREVTEFSDVADDISLFRTNDFRVGFVAEVNGDIEWVLTDRNYAGMSYFPEIVRVTRGGFTKVELTETLQISAVAPPEHVEIVAGSVCCVSLDDGSSVLVGTCTNARVTGDKEITLTFTQKVVGDLERLCYAIVIQNNVSKEYYKISDVSYGANERTLEITTEASISKDDATAVVIGPAVVFLQNGKPGIMTSVEPFTWVMIAPNEPQETEYISLEAGSMTTIDLIEIFRLDAHSNPEYVSVMSGVFTHIVLTKVGTGDI